MEKEQIEREMQRLQIPSNVKFKGLKDIGTIQKTRTDQAPASVNVFERMVEKAIETGNMELIKEIIAERNKELARVAELDFREAKADFQRNCPPIRRNATVDYTLKDQKGKVNYVFADLDEIIEKVKKPLADAGLSYDWKDEGFAPNGDIIITCVLSHVSGHKETNTQQAPPDASGGKSVIHARQSTRTYLKRQTLSDVLGISPGNRDDDGKAGSGYDDAQVVGTMPRPTVAEFNNIVKKYRVGELSMDEIQSTYALTAEQQETLQSLK